MLTIPCLGHDPIQIISTGGSCYIGESGLDISEPVPAAGTQMGWWADESAIDSTAPTRSIVVADPLNFFVDPSIFAGYTGNWYVLPGKTLGFTVIDPQLSLSIEDVTTGTDCTDGNIVPGHEIGFIITGNLYNAEGGTPVSINITGPAGNSNTTFSVTSASFHTGTVLDSSSLSGLYTISAVCNLNGMNDNYQNSGQGFVGRTISKTLRIILVTPPVTAFGSDKQTGTAPLTVRFSDSSLNTPNGWAWFFGDETYTAPWTQLNASSGWIPRHQFSSVVLRDGSIVLMGGWDGDNMEDVWRSTDNGATWKPMNWTAWPARHAHSSVAMEDGTIVLTGGYHAAAGQNDTWQSVDNGATWTLVNASSVWAARGYHSSVAMRDGGIVLTGGRDTAGRVRNDTWRSGDNGATWKRMSASSGWSGRSSHSTVAGDGVIVLTGGWDGSSNYNDTWQSTDKGATWTLVNASSGWSARAGHSTVKMPDGSILLMGGNSAGTPKNDVWRSTDKGATWTLVTASAGWSARAGHSIVTMPDGSIVLMGGSYGSYKNDTWRFQPVGSSIENPTHTYTVPGIYSVALKARNADGFNTSRIAGYITVYPTGSDSDNGVFRSGQWILDYGMDGTVNRRFNYGLATDKPLVGDFNNDGTTDIGVFRSGQWILDYGMDGTVNRRFNYGLATDKPLVGDFNNDGTTDIGVFRSGQWILDYGIDGTVNRRLNYGMATDNPIRGDFNNDGTTDIGVFRAGQWILDYGMDGTVNRRFNYGLATDTPLIGDFNKDSTTDIGVFRAGQWILDYGTDGTVNRRFNYGLATDTPLVGKWV